MGLKTGLYRIHVFSPLVVCYDCIFFKVDGRSCSTRVLVRCYTLLHIGWQSKPMGRAAAGSDGGTEEGARSHTNTSRDEAKDIQTKRRDQHSFTVSQYSSTDLSQNLARHCQTFHWLFFVLPSFQQTLSSSDISWCLREVDSDIAIAIALQLRYQALTILVQHCTTAVQYISTPSNISDIVHFSPLLIG